GKELIQGLKYPIHWNYTGAVDNVIIEIFYKISGVVQNQLITTSTLNTGSFVFDCPNYISDTCWLKITSTADDSIYSLSEPFSIKRPIYEIVFPNGGESLYSGEKLDIIWNWIGGPSTIALQYSLDGGLNFSSITASTPNDGSYKWTLPNILTTQYMIKVFSTIDNEADDTSNAVFSVVDPIISLTKPIITDTAYRETYMPVYWNFRGTISRFKLSFSADDGLSWNTISNSIFTMGYDSFMLDTTYDSIMILKIEDYYNATVFDISDTIFVQAESLLVDSLNLLYPKANDTLYAVEEYYIVWHADSFPRDSVNIYYSTDGITHFSIATNLLNDGIYKWLVPSTVITSNLRIYIENIDNTQSDIVQDIVVLNPQIRILYPNSNTEWYIGRNYYILWDEYEGDFTPAVIDFSADKGSIWQSITSSVANADTFKWKVLNYPTDSFLIRIKDYNNASTFEISDYFKVKPQKIYLTYPISTDTFIVGRDYYITWYNKGGVDSVEVQYSVNGGSNWTSLGVMANNKYYKWTIPNYPSSSVLIKVIDTKNSNVNVISDTFTITKPSIMITSPNILSHWISGRYYYITWDYTG
ncbi:MAG: hypothetical protein COX48_02235, partial [bacterium (Candidatus Stahlbacteria) CG23_combo_of_CG06-09_8_20_14_all_34_7]